MHLDIMSKCLVKVMYLEKLKQIVFWDGESIMLEWPHLTCRLIILYVAAVECATH